MLYKLDFSSCDIMSGFGPVTYRMAQIFDGGKY